MALCSRRMAIRSIVPLDEAHRHSHTPRPLAPGQPFYEWWYFELDFKDAHGEPWRVISSFHHPHALDPNRVLASQYHRNADDDGYFERYGDDPNDFAGVVSYVINVRRRKNMAILISRFDSAAVADNVRLSRPGEPLELVFGECSFKETASGRYALKVKHRGKFYRPGLPDRTLDIDLEASFEQNTPGFHAPDARLLDDGRAHHYWACVMPNPKISVERCRLTKGAGVVAGAKNIVDIAPGEARVIGGYHDHQWGHDMLHRRVQEWNWGQIYLPSGQTPRDKIMFFDVHPVSGPGQPAAPDPVLVEVPGDGGSPQALHARAGIEPFVRTAAAQINYADGCRFGLRGQGMPYFERIDIRANASDGSARDYSIDHPLGSNVDVWPFYLRFMPAVVDATSGATLEDDDGDALFGISEYMRPTRLTLTDARDIFAQGYRVTYVEK